MNRLDQSVEEYGKEHPRSLEGMNPEKAIKMLVALCEGSPHKTVAKLFDSTPGFVRSLSKRHKEVLEEYRPALAAKFATIAGMATSGVLKLLEMAEEDPSLLLKWGPYNLTTISAIATDKADKLTDRPSAIVEHKHTATLEDARRLKERLEEKYRDN